MISQNNLNIVIVEEDLLEKWLCAKIPIAKESGFTQYALNKRIYLKNGIAKIANAKEIKQKIQFLAAIL